MAVWMPVGDGFIEADVIRWKEPVFRNRRHGRAARVGERVVTAEVLGEDDKDGWVYLLVRASTVVSAYMGWSASDVLLPATGAQTRRKRSTLVRGNPERLAWSDESARAIVASQFLGSRKPIPSVSADTRKNYSRQLPSAPFSRTNKKRSRKPGPTPPGPHD